MQVDDHLNRLVAKESSNGTQTQLFYAFPDKPFLVSHVYSPKQGVLQSLIYDDGGQLIYLDYDGEKSYVICDTIGSPILTVSPTGKITREINRQPFGKVTYDSLHGTESLPLGFAGGISDDETGILHIQVKKGFKYDFAKLQKCVSN